MPEPRAMPPSLHLVHDASADQPEPTGCGAAPMFWCPPGGVHHGSEILGVRWFCETCKVEGAPAFGPSRDLVRLAREARALFLTGFANACPPEEDELVPLRHRVPVRVPEVPRNALGYACAPGDE